MRITDHILRGDDPLILPYEPAVNIDELIVPELVVLHETASSLAHGSAAAFLRRSREVSCHFTIERNGAIRQQAPTNRACDHAGQSSWHGRRGCNAFSVGIELVGPGRMTAAGARLARTWWGELLSQDDHHMGAVETPEHGAGVWMAFEARQVESLLALVAVLLRDVPTLRDVRGHWYVSPGRKVDPNPLLDIDRLRALVLGPTDPSEREAEAASVPIEGVLPRLVRTRTPGDTLALRRWPSFNPNVVARIPDGTVLEVLRMGHFDGRHWLRVPYGGREGWIVAAYTTQAEDA